MLKSYSAMAQKKLSDDKRRESVVKKNRCKDHKWNEDGESWIGTVWKDKHEEVQSNPSLNQIKEGLQIGSIKELFNSPNMALNPYLEQVKTNVKHIWDAIFAQIIFEGNRDAPIPEEILYESREKSPFVRALLQIYFLMSNKIELAANEEDES